MYDAYSACKTFRLCLTGGLRSFGYVRLSKCSMEMFRCSFSSNLVGRMHLPCKVLAVRLLGKASYFNPGPPKTLNFRSCGSFCVFAQSLLGCSQLWVVAGCGRLSAIIAWRFLGGWQASHKYSSARKKCKQTCPATSGRPLFENLQ